MPYYLNFQKQYKIWFSPSPEVFLGRENQLRYIRTRENNKQADLTFIYSSKCLSDKALNQLHIFCTKYRIKPVDFDTEIPSLLKTQQDKEIYALAQQELVKTLKQTGGNVAAASDLVRLLPIPGIYSDFDVELNFNGIKQTTIQSPILLHCSTLHPIPSISNEIFAAAFENAEMTVLSSDALKMLKNVQLRVIEHYKNPKNAILNSWHPNIPSPLEQLCPLSFRIAQFYFKINPQASVFDFRIYAKNLNIQELRKMPFLSYISSDPSLSDAKCKENFGRKNYNDAPEWCSHFKAPNYAVLAGNLIELVKHRLLFSSVIGVSGPKATMSVFDDYIPQKLVLDSYEYNHFIEQVENSSVSGNCLSQYVLEKSSKLPKHPLEQVGEVTDLSWTTLGAERQRKRDLVLTIEALLKNPVTAQVEFQDKRLRADLLEYLTTSQKSKIKNASDLEFILKLLPENSRESFFKDMILKKLFDFSLLKNGLNLMNFLKCFSAENRLAMFALIPKNQRLILLNDLIKLTGDEDFYINIDSTNPFKWLEPFFLELGLVETVNNIKNHEINAVSQFKRGQCFFAAEEVLPKDEVTEIGLPAQYN